MAKNAMAPQQDGIPGRKGQGLGQSVNNADTPRGMETEKDETRLLGSLDVPDAATAKATGQTTIKSPSEVNADRRAALKKLELLSDQRAQTVKQMLKQDATQNIPSDMPPW
jgi:hypothetical protein